MNIFYLDEDPIVISEMMCDKHNVKMIVESAQMLCTAHRVLDGDEFADDVGLYKATHKNHPSSVWTRETDENYYWHFDLCQSDVRMASIHFVNMVIQLHKCMGLFYPLEDGDLKIIKDFHKTGVGFTPYHTDITMYLNLGWWNFKLS